MSLSESKSNNSDSAVDYVTQEIEIKKLVQKAFVITSSPHKRELEKD